MLGKQGEMMYNRNEYQGFVGGGCLGYIPGDEPMTLTRCYSCGLPQLYKALGGGGFSAT